MDFHSRFWNSRLIMLTFWRRPNKWGRRPVNLLDRYCQLVTGLNNLIWIWTRFLISCSLSGNNYNIGGTLHNFAKFKVDEINVISPLFHVIHANIEMELVEVVQVCNLKRCYLQCCFEINCTLCSVVIERKPRAMFDHGTWFN